MRAKSQGTVFFQLEYFPFSIGESIIEAYTAPDSVLWLESPDSKKDSELLKQGLL